VLAPPLPSFTALRRVFAKNNAEVIVDPASFDLIRGSTVDYQQELIRSAFAVTNNPHSESACGCGSSFAVKAFSQNPAID
jgi:iron-sulfur cluster assembly 2